MHIRILNDAASVAPIKEWTFNYSDKIIFQTLLDLNGIFGWASKKEMTRLANHMYGIQTKPIACAVPEYVDADDLETLSKCLIGYHSAFSQTSKFIHSKIDWSYAQKSHRVKDTDMTYYLSEKSINDTLEIITSWAEILQI